MLLKIAKGCALEIPGEGIATQREVCAVDSTGRQDG
jgi:hypothetical protein